MKKYAWLFFCTAVLLSLSIGIPDAVKAQTVQVNVCKIQKEDIETCAIATGKIEASEQYEVESKIPLVLQSAEVEVGDMVKKGQTLAIVDEEATTEQLVDIGNTTGTSFLAGTYDVSQLTIPQTLTASEEGTVSTVSAIAGQTMQPGILFTIASTTKLQVRANISEDIISSIEVGQKAIITGSGFKDREYMGKVEKIDPSAKQITGSVSTQTVVEAVISIDQPDAYLKSGFSAKVKIITDRADDVVVVPYEAVRQDEENHEYVYKILGDQAFRQYILSGREVEQGIEVLEGVRQGDLLALNPKELDSDRERVAVGKVVE